MIEIARRLLVDALWFAVAAMWPTRIVAADGTMCALRSDLQPAASVPCAVTPVLRWEALGSKPVEWGREVVWICVAGWLCSGHALRGGAMGGNVA